MLVSRRHMAAQPDGYRKMDNTAIQLMTVGDCCKSGRFSRATFYRLAKNDPNFPKLLKIGSSTRVRGDRWDAYVDSLSEQDDEAA